MPRITTKVPTTAPVSPFYQSEMYNFGTLLIKALAAKGVERIEKHDKTPLVKAFSAAYTVVDGRVVYPELRGLELGDAATRLHLVHQIIEHVWYPEYFVIRSGPLAIHYLVCTRMEHNEPSAQWLSAADAFMAQVKTT